MGPLELLQWQWTDYPRYHRSRTNLRIHIVAVPLFLIGNALLIAVLFDRSLTTKQFWVLCLGSLLTMGLSFGLQGLGHRTEKEPPKTFTSLGNAIARVFSEQWITFPRFVLSGGWRRSLQD